MLVSSWFNLQLMFTFRKEHFYLKPRRRTISYIYTENIKRNYISSNSLTNFKAQLAAIPVFDDDKWIYLSKMEYIFIEECYI